MLCSKIALHMYCRGTLVVFPMCHADTLMMTCATMTLSSSLTFKRERINSKSVALKRVIKFLIRLWKAKVIIVQMDSGGEYDDLLQRVRELQHERGMSAMEAAATAWTESGRSDSVRSFSRLVLTQCVLPNGEDVLSPEKTKTKRRNEVSNREQTITSNSTVKMDLAKSNFKMHTYEKNQIDILIKRPEINKTDSEVKLNNKSKNVTNNACKQEQDAGETDQRSTTRSQHDSKGVRFSADDEVIRYCFTEIEQDEQVQRVEECTDGPDAEPQHSPKVLALAASLSSKLEQLRESDADLTEIKLNELSTTIHRGSCSIAALQVIAEDVLAMQRRAQRRAQRHNHELPVQRVVGQDEAEGTALEDVVRGTARALRNFLEVFPERVVLTAHLTRVLTTALSKNDELQIKLATEYVNKFLLASTDETSQLNKTEICAHKLQ